MGERILLLAVFALVLAVGTITWRRYLDQRSLKLASAGPPPQLATLPLATSPIVLYFTTDSCAQCRFQQTPALEQVRANHQSLQVLRLDAIEYRDLADHYHVMTVPTTVVLDGQHRPVAINHGLATATRLHEQLAKLA